MYTHMWRQHTKITWANFKNKNRFPSAAFSSDPNVRTERYCTQEKSQAPASQTTWNSLAAEWTDPPVAFT